MNVVENNIARLITWTGVVNHEKVESKDKTPDPPSSFLWPSFQEITVQSVSCEARADLDEFKLCSIRNLYLRY